MDKWLRKLFLREIGLPPDRIPVHGLVKVSCLTTAILEFDHIKSTLTLNEIAKLMNDYYSGTAEVIMKSGGSIDHFSGQFITCFYSLDRQNISGQRIMEAAIELVEIFQKFKLQLHLGVGICFDDIIYDSFGSNERATFAGVGPAVWCARNIAIVRSNVNVCEQFQRRNSISPTKSVLVTKHKPLTNTSE